MRQWRKLAKRWVLFSMLLIKSIGTIATNLDKSTILSAVNQTNCIKLDFSCQKILLDSVARFSIADYYFLEWID
jgi:hypothetical protein